MTDSINLRKRILKMRELNKLKDSKNNLNNFKTRDDNLENIKKNNKILENINYNERNQSLINSKSVSNNYDKQFTLLANKFNEATEVILELSENVKKLETIVYSKDKEKIKYEDNSYKLKLLIFVLCIMFICFAIYFVPIDMITFRLFLDDILFLL